MKVRILSEGWEEVEMISLTPVFKNGDIKWYLCYINKKGKLDYFWTNHLERIEIIKDETTSNTDIE